LISHCGLKDKNAITRQWFSLHIPGRESPTAEELESEGVRVLRITRNLRKLHRGSHDGNRFIIRLRDCAVSKEAVVERCDLPPENESTTELMILLEFGFNKGETQWDENVIQPSRSLGNY
jgi:tRNA(Glu) U13 pseudouridine synthase TruD